MLHTGIRFHGHRCLVWRWATCSPAKSFRSLHVPVVRSLCGVPDMHRPRPASRPLRVRLARSKWHFLHSLSNTGTTPPADGRVTARHRPGPQTPMAAGRRARPLLSGASGLVSVGPTVHAEPAMRFCRLRAMQQPELLADEPRFVFWTVRRRGLQHGTPICGRPGEVPAKARVELRQLGRWRNGSPVGQGSVHHGWSQGPRSFTRHSSRPRRGRYRGERRLWPRRGQHGARQHP